MPTAAPESRIPAWAWAALPLLAGAWLRGRGIGGPEPFADEGALILTALDAKVRAVIDPLGQGRPALAWLFLPAGWFPAHALEVGRLMSAGAGLATVAALGWTLRLLGGRPAMLIGMWLWAVMPFAVLHERLALQDPFVTALLAGAVALLVTGSRSARSRNGLWFLAAGALFGTAGLCKISAAFALPWLGLFYAATQVQLARPVFSRHLAWMALGALVPLLCLGSDLPGLGRHIGSIESLPSLSAGNFGDSARHRLAAWVGWYAGYGRWPLALLGLGALLFAVQSRSRLALAAALGAVLSIGVATVFFNRPFARYVLPDHLPLILFMALAWGWALSAPGRRRAIATSLLLLALGRWGVVAWQIGTDPTWADIPAGEIAQYHTGPWSGRGLHEVTRFLSGHAGQHRTNCLVLTHRYYRPGCYGLMLAALADPRLGVVPFTIYDPADLAAARAGLRHAAAGQRVAFFILYEGSLYPAHPWLETGGSPAHRVFEIPHGTAGNFTLYQLDR